MFTKRAVAVSGHFYRHHSHMYLLIYSCILVKKARLSQAHIYICKPKTHSYIPRKHKQREWLVVGGRAERERESRERETCVCMCVRMCVLAYIHAWVCGWVCVRVRVSDANCNYINQFCVRSFGLFYILLPPSANHLLMKNHE